MSMEDTIRKKLTESLNPTILEVINDSHLHTGHAGDNGTGDSHFRLRIAAPSLQRLSRVEAQRQIYRILDTELKNGLHALSINVLSDKE